MFQNCNCMACSLTRQNMKLFQEKGKYFVKFCALFCLKMVLFGFFTHENQHFSALCQMRSFGVSGNV